MIYNISESYSNKILNFSQYEQSVIGFLQENGIVTEGIKDIGGIFKNLGERVGKIIEAIRKTVGGWIATLRRKIQDRAQKKIDNEKLNKKFEAFKQSDKLNITLEVSSALTDVKSCENKKNYVLKQLDRSSMVISKAMDKLATQASKGKNTGGINGETLFTAMDNADKNHSVDIDNSEKRKITVRELLIKLGVNPNTKNFANDIKNAYGKLSKWIDDLNFANNKKLVVIEKDLKHKIDMYDTNFKSDEDDNSAKSSGVSFFVAEALKGLNAWVNWYRTEIKLVLKECTVFSNSVGSIESEIYMWNFNQSRAGQYTKNSKDIDL